jgi:hypothetical protein
MVDAHFFISHIVIMYVGTYLISLQYFIMFPCSYPQIIAYRIEMIDLLITQSIHLASFVKFIRAGDKSPIRIAIRKLVEPRD